ncbi:phage repressor protein/antirepressor Ant, partial [bacterium 1XD42-1]
QAFIADEVIPSIRRHGVYMTPETLEAAILNPDTLIKLCTALKEEQDKRKSLEAANSALTVDNAVMKPKADYFDELVDRNLLTNFRETAKQLGIKEKEFIRFLMEKKYLYRDKRGKLMPYAEKNNGLFEIKECFNEKTQWSGTQILITPKGRETFRLLYVG